MIGSMRLAKTTKALDEGTIDSRTHMEPAAPIAKLELSTRYGQ